MSPIQLQEIFHVEHKDLVPNYEVVELKHLLSNIHDIHKRSINSDNVFSRNQVSPETDNRDKNKSKVLGKENHHVKKDLSKTKLNDSNDFTDVDSAPRKFNNYDLKSVQEHTVSFNAFGQHVNLTLKPTKGLFKNGPNFLKMWHVRPDANASQGLLYEPVEEVRFSIHLN
jgi:hypothetical protein